MNELAWEQQKAAAATQVARWERDYLREDPETPMDPRVRPLVIDIAALGYEPTGSCEGHEIQPGRMSDTYVVLFVKREQLEGWADLCRALLITAPMLVGTRIEVGRSGHYGRPDRTRWVLAISYPHLREDVWHLKAQAIDGVVAWLDDWALKHHIHQEG